MTEQIENIPKKDRTNLIFFMVAAIMFGIAITLMMLIFYSLIHPLWSIVIVITGVIAMTILANTIAES